MFKLLTNAFAEVPCPQLRTSESCNIVNCFFSHGGTKRSLQDEEKLSKRARIDPATTPKSDPSLLRESQAESSQKCAAHTQDSKTTVAEEIPKKDLLFVIPKDLKSDVLIPRSERLENAKAIAKFISANKSSPTPNRLAIETEHKLASESGSLSEYRTKCGNFLGVETTQGHDTDPKFITPLDVNPSPALLPVRRNYINLFATAIRENDPSVKTPVWAAIEEEFKIASTCTSATYNMAIKRKLYEIKNPTKVKKPVSSKPSKEAYLKELRDLCISKEKLVKYGFIMDLPAQIDAPEPIRECNRCKMEFKLADSENVVDCGYHQGRLVKNKHGVRIYLCCGGVFGETDTEPCTRSEHHVFSWINAEEKHHFLPYIETSRVWGTRKNSLEAIGIDCEMGYTTKGFELLRITAVDFFSGESVLDILVRPKGKVLDLNTKWSGVAEIKEEAVSFEDLIMLLGEIADANTVMVGHGLENDMNAMRLIHNKLVDTAVLYPKHKTLPTFRFSLKQLTFQYLGRNIQAGEHDSGEDSLAAIDVTKYFIEQDLERAKRN